ncbi:MAG: aspartate carbamoyltransferase catalytic subunit [Phycisphaerales bacterium]|nr:MAG: aspartate carbamoyltransferase catalytic subunit [Phycisphaerales bacterium]
MSAAKTPDSAAPQAGLGRTTARAPSAPESGRGGKEAPAWRRKHLLGIEELSAEEIIHVLDTASGFAEVSTRSIKKVPALRGKVVANLFIEDSTRTRTSFSLAAQRLSADVLDFYSAGSSLSKGESVRDTARNIEAMGVDIIVLRHSAAGAAHYLSRCVNTSIINAGDGQHEHPTQALLDTYTIRETKGRVEGLRVAIVGDIGHSRVARSNIWCLQKLGAEVTVVGPATLVPKGLERMGARISHNFDDVIPEMDVINMLRVQSERISSRVFPSLHEYTWLFGMTPERLERAKPDVLILHPGPINRGIELAAEVADGPRSSILRQVANGLAVRMAVLFLVNQAASVSA